MSSQLDKDISIINSLERLSKDLGKGTFVIQDHWDGDLNAVGIAKQENAGILVYISIFGCSEGRYDVHLELPPKLEDPPYEDAAEYYNVDYLSLAVIVSKHFEANL